VTVAFIDEHRASLGVEPVCGALRIAPSTYYEHQKRIADPEHRCAREKDDEQLKFHIQRVWDVNFRVYGARKIWCELKREGRAVARCTVERLMRALGLQGVVRGKSIRTTIARDDDQRPMDLVQRNFTATRPNQLWVADFTYVATWIGFVFVAFITDAFSKMIVGWKVAKSMHADLTLDALEQALWARKVNEPLIHHSDRGSQYLSIRYGERLAEANIAASVGSVGDAYDNALAETINGLYKTEVIRKRSSWKGIEDVEYATLEWVDWFNKRRLLSSIGNIPPAEFEEAYYTGLDVMPKAAGLT
jgi:transposase InsO family protein